MEPSTDTELRELFREEVAERARRLVEAAEAMAAGSTDGWDVSSLARDAHTIKGSCRVMGYPAMAGAAEVLEHTWRRLEQGTEAPSSELGIRLRDLAQQLPPSVEAPPEAGSPELGPARERLEAAEPAAMRTPVRPDPDPAVLRSESLDLGGLLSSLEEDVGEGTTTVETGKLYRLINRLAELRVEARVLEETLDELGSSPRDRMETLLARWGQGVEGIGRTADDLQAQAVALAGVPLREITDTLPRLARYVAGKLGKEVRLELVGDDAEVDRQVAERISDPLRHLLVNAIDHGIETPAERSEAGKAQTGTVAVRAQVTDGRFLLVVEDDGRGIDWETVDRMAGANGLVTGEAGEEELVRALFAEGFSTSPSRTEFSGDGSGLALLAAAVDTLGGSVSVVSRRGEGTLVELALPAWRALQEAVLVRAGDHHWGIPRTAVLATLPVSEAQLVSRNGGPELLWGEQMIPAASLAAAVGLTDEDQAGTILVLSTRGGLLAVTVPEVLGSRQVATKSLGPLLGGAPLVAGAAVLGGGEIVAMIDPNRLVESVRRLGPALEGRRPAVLVVDDSAGVRRLMAAALAGQGFEPVVARDADEALEHLGLRRFDALVVDYSMPGPDGIQLAASARDLDPDLPIVMVSGVADREDQARARAAGVDAYFDKSDLREGALADTLHSLIGTRSASLGMGS